MSDNEPIWAYELAEKAKEDKSLIGNIYLRTDGMLRDHYNNEVVDKIIVEHDGRLVDFFNKRLVMFASNTMVRRVSEWKECSASEAFAAYTAGEKIKVEYVVDFGKGVETNYYSRYHLVNPVYYTMHAFISRAVGGKWFKEV